MLGWQRITVKSSEAGQPPLLDESSVVTGAANVLFEMTVCVHTINDVIRMCRNYFFCVICCFNDNM